MAEKKLEFYLPFEQDKEAQDKAARLAYIKEQLAKEPVIKQVQYEE